MPRLSTLRKNSLSNLPDDVPKIKMPFPPNMTAEEFLRSRPLSRTYFKSPNSFFIYRQQFVKQLKLENYNDQMIKVSKWASIFWSKEPNHVKQYYKDIEKNIQKLLNEQYKNEQNNPCQNVFIFEYPNSNDDDDNSRIVNPSTDSPFVASIDSGVAGWLPASESSVENSPTSSEEIIYFEEPTNFFPPFATTPMTSPIYYQSDNFYENNMNNMALIDNYNLESIINLFDTMDDFDGIPFSSNETNHLGIY